MDRVITPGFVDSFDGFFPDAPVVFLVEDAGFWVAVFLVTTTRFFPDVLSFADGTCFLVAGFAGSVSQDCRFFLAGAAECSCWLF